MGGYLSSSPFGWPDVPGSIGIYQTSAVNRVNKPVGEYLQVGLRGFRFAKNGATELAKGKLTCAAAIATDDPDLINIVVTATAAAGDYVVKATVTATNATTIAANEFYWSLVWGPVAALADANPPTAIHQGVIPSDATIGAIEIEASGSVTRRVGYAMLAGGSGEDYPIFATIG